MVLTLPYPKGGIQDPQEWRWEVAVRAYDDEQLTLRQVAIFVGLTPYEVAIEFKRRGVEIYLDADDLVDERRAAAETVTQNRQVARDRR